MEEGSKEGKISWVLGLVIECPLQKPLVNCPAKGLRDLPVQDCVALISDMEEVQLNEIISYHRQCLWGRERELLGREG